MRFPTDKDARWAVVLGLPGLLACAGASGGVSLDGTVADTVRLSPAGSAALAFLDLEALRPDLLLDSSGLPGCVQKGVSAGGAATYTFNGCPAANGGTLSGTVTVSGPAGGDGVYLETLGLTATARLSGQVQAWTYRGSLQVTVAGGIAQETLADPASPVQATLSGTQDGTFAFTPTDLSETLGARTLFGTCQFRAVESGDRIVVAIRVGDPLVWNPAACRTPVSGAEVLTLFNGLSAAINDQTVVSFDQGCGSLAVGGKAIPLGGP